jgi:hypothetical protein
MRWSRSGVPWTYKARPETVTVDPRIRERVLERARGDRVAAVGLLREETGLSLTFAVALVDSWLGEASSPDAS